MHIKKIEVNHLTAFVGVKIGVPEVLNNKKKTKNIIIDFNSIQETEIEEMWKAVI